MSSRSTIVWRVMDGEGPQALWTTGWIPDSNTLRWSLGSAIRVEGVREGWQASFEASENATVIHSYVGVDEAGDDVEVDSEGMTLWGEEAEHVTPATLAILNLSIGP